MTSNKIYHGEMIEIPTDGDLSRTLIGIMGEEGFFVHETSIEEFNDTLHGIYISL